MGIIEKKMETTIGIIATIRIITTIGIICNRLCAHHLKLEALTMGTWEM